jgi:hypothetical protein
LNFRPQQQQRQHQKKSHRHKKALDLLSLRH